MTVLEYCAMGIHLVCRLHVNTGGVNRMKATHKGILFTALSAVIFGFTPILARITYDGGANGTSITFLRAVLSLPVLFVLLKRKGISFRLHPTERKGILLVGIFGTSLTTILLYISYSYIPVGMATTLHFGYPMLVAAGCVCFFQEKMNAYKLTALASGTAGIALFFERGSQTGVIGMVLALLSGVTYAFYIIYVDKCGLKEMYYFKLSFYLCVMMSLVSGGFGLATGTLTLNLTPKAWLFALLVSLFTSVGAISLFQLGIKLTGAPTAAILSTLEPIISVVLGVLVLGESISVPKIVGCLFILVSVVLITLSEAKAGAEKVLDTPPEN